MRKEMAALIADDAHLGQDIAGEIANDVIVKRLETARLPSAIVTSFAPECNAKSVEMPPPNWVMKVLGADLTRYG